MTELDRARYVWMTGAAGADGVEIVRIRDADASTG